MKYQVVIQFPEALVDYDMLIEIEEDLLKSMEDVVDDVDGHDLGSGESNVFIHTNDPEVCFARVKRAIDIRKISRSPLPIVCYQPMNIRFYGQQAPLARR